MRKIATNLSLPLSLRRVRRVSAVSIRVFVNLSELNRIMGNSGYVYDLQICRPGSFFACFVRAQRANEDGARVARGTWHVLISCSNWDRFRQMVLPTCLRS